MDLLFHSINDRESQGSRHQMELQQETRQWGTSDEKIVEPKAAESWMYLQLHN